MRALHTRYFDTVEIEITASTPAYDQGIQNIALHRVANNVKTLRELPCLATGEAEPGVTDVSFGDISHSKKIC
jgi:hypothetical protein